MKRREALALVATLSVPLAGCSSGDGDGENETDGGTEPTRNTTDVDGNSSDVNAGDGSDGNESDSDGQTDDGSDEPSEEELAQEDVDAAQSALSEAVGELENQGTTYGSLSDPGDQGPPVTAGVSGLSDGPIRDQLSSVQSAIDAAREHETTGDQEKILTAIETAKDWLHTVLDAYQPVRDLYLEAHYAVQDYTAEGSDPDVQAVQRAADQAQSPAEAVTDPYNEIQNVGRLDAITQAGFEAQRDRIQAEFGSGQSVADAIEALQAGGELFWPARETYRDGGDDVDTQDLADARDAYDDASSAASGLSASFEAAEAYLTCHTPSMNTAAEEYRMAVTERKANSQSFASEYANAGEAAVEDAEGCSFDWSA